MRDIAAEAMEIVRDVHMQLIPLVFGAFCEGRVRHGRGCVFRRVSNAVRARSSTVPLFVGR